MWNICAHTESTDKIFNTFKQCCRFMSFWCGSGPADPCLWLMDPDHFSRIKCHKESQNSRNQCFSYYFCKIIEGSGSGSGRPKNMWIRWILVILHSNKIFISWHSTTIPRCLLYCSFGCWVCLSCWSPPPPCWWQDAQSDGLELIHSITSPPQLFPYISLGEMEAYVMSVFLDGPPPVTQRVERLRETGKEGSHSSCVANGNRGRQECSQFQQR